MSLVQTLEASMVEAHKAGRLTPDDRGAAELALLYADLIDENPNAEVTKDLGPKLHALLNDLGLTPRGRREPAKTGEVKPDDTPRGKLLALRGGNTAGAGAHASTA